MTDSIIPFDAFEDEIQISAHQTSLPRVILEGGDDVVLFKSYWFFDFLDRYEFVQAGDIANGNGCGAVRLAVARSVQDGIPAYGLIDRDELFKVADWPVLFSLDEAAFAAQTADAAAATNQLWEIEAYLFEPDVIPRWVRSHHRQAPASPAICAAAMAMVVEECEHLLNAQPWLATAHRAGVREPDGKHSNVPAPLFATRCAADLAALQDPQGTAQEVTLLIGQVLAQAPQQPEQRLRWLLRYVDTKRLMLRLVHRLNLGNARHKWVLAEFMASQGLRPGELEQKLANLTPLQPA